MPSRDGLAHAVFLSTLSLRRATRRPCLSRSFLSNFYPRSPCGERLLQRDKQPRQQAISIHALLAESDCGHRSIKPGLGTISIHALLAESDTFIIYSIIDKCISIHALLAESDPAVIKNNTAFSVFLSTLSLRRATSAPGPCSPHAHISIHALLAESDQYLTFPHNRI